jgi:tight adherence protein B
MRRAAFLAFVSLALLGAVSQASGDEIRIIEVDDQDDPAVTLTVVLPGELSGAVLGADNFSVSENGELAEIEVSAVRNDSLEVVLLIDTSGSMTGEPLLLAQQAAVEFIAGFPPESSLAVVGFGDVPTVVAPMGSPAEVSVTAVTSLLADGNTPLFDAVAIGLEQFTGAERQALIVLSDGEDTSSVTTLEEIQAQLEEESASLVGIALRSDEAELSLSALSEEGIVVRADDPAALADIYGEISAGLVSQYRIAFVATETGALDVVVSVTYEAVTYLGSTLVTIAGPQVVVPRQPPVQTDATVRGVTLPTPVVLASTAGLGSQGWALVVGALAVGVSLLIFALVILVPTKRDSVLASMSFSERAAQTSLGVDSAKSSMAAAAERALERRGKRSELDSALERAGMQLRAGEFVVMVTSAALLGAMFAFLIGGILLALIVGSAVWLGARLLLRRKARKRGEKFSEQLPTTLQLLAGNLRTGHGISQAITSVAAESEEPTSVELNRVIAENRLGRDLGTALANMSERVGDEDFDWVVQAIAINREVGGDLAEILDNVQVTIADRNRIRREIAALSADGRLSMILLLALPFVVALGFSITNPGYLDELLDRSAGRIMLAVGFALLFTGWLWLRRVTEVRF